MKPTPEYLLALETSGDVCGVALLRDGLLMAEHTFRHEMHLSERLMSEVDTVLNRAGSALQEVVAFAVGIGPGSFTGTRIGVMTVKTFASVLDRPLYGIGALEALAAPFTGLQETLVVPILPCRAGVVFACAYGVEAEPPAARMKPAALPLAELAETLTAMTPRDLHFCGSAVARYKNELAALLADTHYAVTFGLDNSSSAAAVARLAYLRRAAGSPPDDPLSLVPLYIAPPPITQPKQPIPSPITGD